MGQLSLARLGDELGQQIEHNTSIARLTKWNLRILRETPTFRPRGTGTRGTLFLTLCLHSRQMSPYVVPDHRLASVQLERNTDNLPKTLTPTFWAELTIVPFDNLADPAQSNATPNDSAPAELLQESMDTDTTTTLSKLADPQPPYVPHERFFFDDGNITFLVRPLRFDVHSF